MLGVKRNPDPITYFSTLFLFHMYSTVRVILLFEQDFISQLSYMKIKKKNPCFLELLALLLTE